jgi:tetratricopeptide (TPR) repeat protein
LQLIQELLSDVYPLARQTLIYAETITGEMEYKGAGEFRDVLEHIKRAIVDAENDDEARDDITEAYEHLRRAAVESAQRAASKSYAEMLKTIRFPSFLHRIALVSLPDKKTVNPLRSIAIHGIEEGRYLKSDKERWPESIEEFKKAIDACNQILELYPSRTDSIIRLITIYSALIGVIGTILTVMSFYRGC